jgi:citrate synthase
MTQLGIGVAALNHDSSFQAAYEKGMKKGEYWTHTLEDCISLIARLPMLAARIYRNIYKPGTPLLTIDKDLDLVGKNPRFWYISYVKNGQETTPGFWDTEITIALPNTFGCI